MIVCNTSPLISLAILGKIHLIKKLYGDWAVPDRVLEESTVDKKPFSRELKNILPSHLINLKSKILSASYEIYLDPGEAEVVALAEELNVKIILIDDKKGRRFAESKGFKVVGTAGILLKAKKIGFIEKVRPEIEKLTQSGIRIADSLRKEMLKLAGEEE